MKKTAAAILGPILGNLLVLAALGATAAYWIKWNDYRADVYRDRLEQEVQEREKLRQHYNLAVKQTAVTELLVDGLSVSVRIRNIEGIVETITTNVDPDREIYVDYVLVNDRLWIRRVYDSNMRPSDGTVIDPRWVDIDWQNPDVNYGQAIYRGGLTDGRWVIRTSGNGALSLEKIGDDEVIQLEAPPAVRNFHTIDHEVRQEVNDVGFFDVLGKIFGK